MEITKKNMSTVKNSILKDKTYICLLNNHGLLDVSRVQNATNNNIWKVMFNYNKKKSKTLGLNLKINNISPTFFNFYSKFMDCTGRMGRKNPNLR